MKPAPFILGQYRPLDSYLHKLDARAKAIPVVVVLVVGLISDSALFSLVLVCALLISLLVSQIAITTLVHNLFPIFLLAIVTALFHLIFSGQDAPTLFAIGEWHVTTEGARMAALYGLRLLLFVSMAFLITLTTSPSDLADAFATAIRPLRVLKVPVYDLALIVFMAIRFIPILYNEFQTIRHAQMLRGMKFQGGVLHRVRKSSALLIPVFVSALQRADELADAIQMRGYGRSPCRTLYVETRFGGTDVIFVVVTVAAIAFLYFFTSKP